MTKNAEQLIKAFLVHTLAASQHDKEQEVEGKADPSDPEAEGVKPLHLSAAGLQNILRGENRKMSTPGP